MHRPHTFAVLSLIFALMAGLACDENAPTETRTPAGPTELAGGDDPDLALGDITPMGTIPLPINQSIATTAPAPAFRVNQTGTGPNGIFQITRSGSTQTALQGLTNGRGRAGFFQLTNALNSQPGLEVATAGAGPAGLFRTTNVSNVQPVVRAIQAGSGPAGRFEITNTTTSANGLEVASSNQASEGGSDRATLAVTQSGGGMAGFFRTTSTMNGEPVLRVQKATEGSLALQVEGSSTFFGSVFVEGNLIVSGEVSKGGGSFRIDHPLDPEHKYLSHSFVESPDMMNVYNGNATLDANGRATVELPDYFGALNKDFRYQLTAVGAPGPNLYIAEGVKQNRFRIAGGRPYASVSWQVTGVRQDTYANEHRIKVEEDKPAEETKPDADRLVARR